MTIETLTEEGRYQLGPVKCSTAGVKALRIIAAQPERIASLERQVESWERRHDYAWSGKQRAEERLAAADATGTSARAWHLQVHGLDPAEIEVDAMFQGAE